MTDETEPRSQRWQDLVRGQGAASSAESYGEVVERLKQVKREFGNQLGKEFQETFSAELWSRPRETYEEKKALIKWANTELRSLGLALRCPRTGLPTTLRASPDTKNGRLRLRPVGARGGYCFSCSHRPFEIQLIARDDFGERTTYRPSR